MSLEKKPSLEGDMLSWLQSIDCFKLIQKVTEYQTCDKALLYIAYYKDDDENGKKYILLSFGYGNISSPFDINIPYEQVTTNFEKDDIGCKMEFNFLAKGCGSTPEKLREILVEETPDEWKPSSTEQEDGQ